MKVLLTGAHFTPAVATIEELKKYPDVEIVYVGRKTTLEGDKAQSLESKILPNLGVRFIPIVTGRLQRSLSFFTFFSFLKIPIGLIQALIIILAERPKVILSFGGYVAAPIVLAGWLFSIPIIIHEQTLVSGLANRIGSFFADKIAISFNTNNKVSGILSSKDCNSSNYKTILTGNPIRKEILEVSKKVSKGLPTILVTGGNQGSHILNTAIENILPKLTKMANVIHISGDSKFRDFDRLAKFQNDRYQVKKWAGEEWAKILSKSDLAVSRAGINTLTEFAYLGMPAIVVPIPYLFADEQNKNAKYFQRLGLVKIFPQSQLTSETLLKQIVMSLRNLNNLKERAKQAKSVVIIDAAKRLALETVLLTKM